MEQLKIWAPHAKRVQIELATKPGPKPRTKLSSDTNTELKTKPCCQWQKFDLSPSEAGYWTLNAAELKHDDAYSIFIDEEGPYPDPKSRRQPQGVHGYSQWVDHSLFGWTDENWTAPNLSLSSIIYELHVGTFTPEGTFSSLANKLDHFVDLHIDTIELMPIHSFSGQRGWGYDGVDLYSVFEPYGGPEELKKLINKAHEKGIRVILDVVYNHLGPEGNYLSKFGPYFNSNYQTPWGPAINFDGLRLDAIHAIADTSATHFLEELNTKIRLLSQSTGKKHFLIAESDLNNPQILNPLEKGGYDLDVQWSDDFHHVLHVLLTGEQSGYYEDFTGGLLQLKKAFENAFIYTGEYSKHRKRRHGRTHEIQNGTKFLSYIQNHDQVGNRAQGNRLNQLISIEKMKIAATLNLLSPFIPMIFQGEEWGASSPFLFFSHHQDPHIAAGTRQGRRNEFSSFGWKPQDIPDPQSDETFLNSKLKWQERMISPHKEILAWYHNLIHIRKQNIHPIANNLASLVVDFQKEKNIFLFNNQNLLVVINFDKAAQEVTIAKDYEIILTSEVGQNFKKNPMTVSPFSAVILRKLQLKLYKGDL